MTDTSQSQNYPMLADTASIGLEKQAVKALAEISAGVAGKQIFKPRPLKRKAIAIWRVGRE